MNPEVEALSSALQSDPNNWALRMALVELLKAHGEFGQAVQIVSEAPVVPDNEGDLRKIVSTCRDGGQLHVAEPFVATFLAEKPSSAMAHYLYAKLISKTDGDSAKGKEHYQAAVALNPDLKDEALLTKLEELATVVQAEPVAASEPQVQSLTPPPGKATANFPAQPAQVPPIEDEPDSDPYAGIEAATPDVAFGTEPSSPPFPGPVGSPDAQVEGEIMGVPGATTRYIVVAGGESVKPMDKKTETPQKLSAAMIAVLAHVGILALMAFVVLNIPEQRTPEIIARAPVNLEERVFEKQEIKKVVQRKPVQAAAAQMEVLTVAGASSVAIPDLDTDLVSFDPIGMGDSFGASMTFDAGEDGGMVSFFGAKSVSKRVVFAVDYSASMSSQKKDALMRKELAKSLNSLPGGIEYQVIFFAGPAWIHGQNVKSNQGNNSFLVTPERGREEWAWIRGFDPKAKKTGALYHPAWGLEPEKLPKGEYIASTRSNIRKSVKIVQETKLVYGTDWRWPLYMAMNMEPDTIYFMTDGAFGAPNKAKLIDGLIRYSKSKGRPKINTICMMVPNAVEELTALAKGTRGEFSLVLQDQTVLRGKELEEYLKKNRKN